MQSCGRSSNRSRSEDRPLRFWSFDGARKLLQVGARRQTVRRMFEERIRMVRTYRSELA